MDTPGTCIDEAALRDAIRRRVCSVCLDSRGDGSCALPPGRVCTIERHLRRLADVLAQIHSDYLNTYAAALERTVCASCPERQAGQTCPRRGNGECALYAYLMFVVEAIKDVCNPEER